MIYGACVLGGDARIRIGPYCLIATGTQMRASNYETGYANLQPALQKGLGFPLPSRPSKPIEVGANCWIGTNVLHTYVT